MNDKLDHLKSLSSRWAIFPLHWVDGGVCSCSTTCQSPGKHPLIRNGVHGATQDMDKITAWHNNWPFANWAIACGGASRLLVVDVDDDRGGDAVMRELSGGEYPDCPTVKTGSGGNHYYFTAPEEWNPKNSASSIAAGVDIRTNGGYVVAPGSNHIQGMYAWSEFEDEPAPPAPQWLIDRINQAQVEKAQGKEIQRNDRGLITTGWHQWILDRTAELYAKGLSQEIVVLAIREEIPKQLDLDRIGRTVSDKEIIDAYNGASGKFPVIDTRDMAEADEMRKAIIERQNYFAEHEKKPIEVVKETTLQKSLFDRVKGPLRLLYEYCLDSPRKQPEMSLAAALTTFGAVLGGKVETRTGLRSNIYTIAVCGSGGGKDGPRKACKKALIESSMDAWIGADYWASSTAIHTQLTEHRKRVCFVDEFGKVIAAVGDPKASTHLKEIPNILLKVWGAADGRYDGAAYADAKKNVLIEEPHMCVFGTTTHGTLFSALTTESYKDGLLARCMIVPASDNLPQLNHEYSPQPPPWGLVDIFTAWHKYGVGDLLGCRRVHETSTAYKMLNEYSDECDRRIRTGQDELMTLYTRCAEKARKVALIYACAITDPDADEPPVIDEDAAQWAIDYVEATTNYALQECHRSIAETGHERELVLLEHHIRQRAEGFTLSELARSYRRIPKGKLDEL